MITKQTLTFWPLPDDFQFRIGTDRVSATVGIAGVGSFITWLHIVYVQASILSRSYVKTISCHWNPIPEQRERTLEGL